MIAYVHALYPYLQRLATQNRKMAKVYKAMKQELAESKREIETLQLQLNLYAAQSQPEEY